MSRPVRRVLSQPKLVTTIHLRRQLPDTSSSLPGNIRRVAFKRSLFGLAPGGVYQAAAVTCRTGGLLHHLFTLTSKTGGIFSVALSRRSPWVDVIHHRTLWSPDVPRWLNPEGQTNAAAWPTHSAPVYAKTECRCTPWKPRAASLGKALAKPSPFCFSGRLK